MRSVTEFWSATLAKGLSAKTALAAEGKSPEEIQQSLGETFKLEGDKLKYFVNAIEVASQNADKLSRVRVVSFNEGESLPPKTVKVEEMYYIPEFQMSPKPIATQKAAPGKGGAGGKKREGGPKGSPWGLSPEEKAAKKGKAAATAAANAAQEKTNK